MSEPTPHGQNLERETIEEIRRDVHEIKTHIVGDFTSVGLNERVHRLEYAVKWMKAALAAAVAGLGAWIMDHFHYR